MSRTFDLYAPDFPHGTVDGYRQGCHGSVCGAVIACRDVYRRYQGDFSFRRLIGSGMTVAEIAQRDEEERAATIQRDRDAARAARRAEYAARRPARSGNRAPRTPRTPGSPLAPRAPRETSLAKIGPDVARLHTEGMIDTEIAKTLGIHRSYVGKMRRKLNLPRIVRPAEERAPRERVIRASVRDDIARLYAGGLRDSAIADELGVSRGYVATVRSHLGLRAHPRERTGRVYGQRVDRRPDVAAAHAEGLTDRLIAVRLGISHSEVGRLRRELGLKAHSSGRTGGRAATHGHGTNACYARGCRRDECVEAHRQYHRDYDSRRRAAGIANGIPMDHHGTAYGYQLGCRLRKNCPGDISCTEAMLEQDRARRRANGVEAQAPRVPAEPVRAHVRSLLDGGRSVLAIADEAGVSRSGLKTLLYGRSGARKGEYPENIEAEKAQRLLALGVQ